MAEGDHVATALEDVEAGEQAAVYDSENRFLYAMAAEEHIPYGNKIALCSLEQGQPLLKYGAEIGVCTRDIRRGTLVHVHNVKSRVVDIPPAFKKEIMRQMGIRLEEGEL